LELELRRSYSLYLHVSARRVGERWLLANRVPWPLLGHILRLNRTSHYNNAQSAHRNHGRHLRPRLGGSKRSLAEGDLYVCGGIQLSFPRRGVLKGAIHMHCDKRNIFGRGRKRVGRQNWSAEDIHGKADEERRGLKGKDA